MTAKIRVLIADDSESLRRMLRLLLGRLPDVEVVGEARDGTEAVALARALRPTVITMDVDMPGMNGLDATAQIMSQAPARILVVCAVGQARQVALSFRAMNAGALQLIAKPQGPPERLQGWGAQLAEAIRLMAEVPVVTRRRSGTTAPLAPSPRGWIRAIGLVASTGGPPALAEVLGALPAGFPVPVLVAQHIAPGFAQGLVRWLGEVSPLRVVLASAGAPLRAGTVYLPPDGCDLAATAEGVLSVTPSAGGICPSGDRLLSSLARAFGAAAGGVVMTGMGDDGAEGLLELRQRGGWAVAQDEASSTVFGMPQRAWAVGAAEELLPLERIAEALIQVAGPAALTLPA